ncbi:hypothetical protein OAI48_00190 [Candidatus Pelagibacter sp.]|nr:hypothetical protein [Candidatus Pelagibacter sp.]
MKKLLGIVVLSLLLSVNAYAKTIYCYKANIDRTLESESIFFFEIDDRSKKLEWLKHYYESKKDNIYVFEYGDTSNPISVKLLKFNKNEILMYEDFKHKEKNVIYRHYYELDRISGLLLWTYGIQLDSEGNEITKDYEGTIYKRGDEKFDDHINIDKFLCDNHKGL